MDQKIMFPFGKADSIAIASAAVMAATISNQLSLATISQMAAAGTLNLTNSAELRLGARLMIRVSADGTNRVLTPGTGFTGAAVTITASKSFLLEYFYDGTNFVHLGSQLLN